MTAFSDREAVDTASVDPLDLLTVADLCRLLKVRQSWVYDTVEAGQLPTIRLGRQLRFDRADIGALLARSATRRR